MWGDGGAVALPRGSEQWLRAYRDHGKVSRDEIIMWGINARMQTLQCVVALRGLDAVGEAIRKRQLIADFLDRWLGELPGITIPGRALGYGPGDFPVCERQASRMLTLPMNEYLRADEIDFMVATIRGFSGSQ